MRISNLEEGFYSYSLFDLGRAQSSVGKYRECIRTFKKLIGDIDIEKIRPEHFDRIKMKLGQRGCGRDGVASMIYTMKSFLRFCREKKKCKVLKFENIKAPPQKKSRPIKILHRKEIVDLMGGIKVLNTWKMKTREENINLHGLRMKCLLEVLRSSGMRISEALSLNRDSIDFENREAIINGKGDKNRQVFFSKEAINLIRQYLSARHDNHGSLFVTHCEARRWTLKAAETTFKRMLKKLGVKQKITFHTFRKTFASLIFMEHDIYAASLLLGHSDIETTRKHYIFVDWKQMKEIHRAAVEK